MDDSSEEDERLNASKIRGSGHLENARSSESRDHVAGMKDEMKFATRKNREPYGLERVEMKQEEKELGAAGSLYVALTEYKKQDPRHPHPYQ